VQFETGQAALQIRPFGLGLLNPVFAEHPLPGSDNRFYVGSREGFADRDQDDPSRIAPCGMRGVADAASDGV
jgi:hypothetical protein